MKNKNKYDYLDEKIKELYIKGKSSPTIAKDLGIKSHSIVQRHLIKMGVKLRTISQSNKGFKASEKTKKKMREAQMGEKNHMFGKHLLKEHKEKISKVRKEREVAKQEKNPNWMGGLSYEPYTSEFNNNFKLFIRKREGFMCIECGMMEEDAKMVFGRNLIVHHINYDKKLTIPENCCALCLRCHIRSNMNREGWIKFFQSLLAERYGYNYKLGDKI